MNYSWNISHHWVS